MTAVFNLAHFLYLFGFLAGFLCFAGIYLVSSGNYVKILLGCAALMASLALTFKIDPFLKYIGVSKNE